MESLRSASSRFDRLTNSALLRLEHMASPEAQKPYERRARMSKMSKLRFPLSGDT